MKTPRNKSFSYKLSTWLYNFYYKNLFNKLLVGFVVVVPPALISTLYSNKVLKNFILEIHPGFFHSIQSIGRDYVLIFNTLSFIWPSIMVALGAEIAKKVNSDALNVKSLLILLRCLDSIVGLKNKRFAHHVEHLKQFSKDTAFETITDPMNQIACIVQEISVFFNTMEEKNKNALIRVTLAVMKNGRVANLPIFFPNDEPIRSSLDALNSDTSAFVMAHAHGKLLLIPDIQKELKKAQDQRKFAETENEEDNRGSLICFPVRVYDGSYPYVLSIHSDEPNHFKEEDRQVYELILQRFSLRLSVENSLLTLKENLCGK